MADVVQTTWSPEESARALTHTAIRLVGHRRDPSAL
jgi:hypothetical protein